MEFVVQGFLCSSVVLLGGCISSLTVGLILCGPLGGDGITILMIALLGAGFVVLTVSLIFL